MKRISKILFAFVLSFLAIFALTACAKKEIKALDTIKLPEQITTDLELPAKANDFDLVWTSGNTNYPVTGNTLKVPTRPTENQEVSLICQIGKYSKDFKVIVLAKNTKLEELLGKITINQTTVDVLEKITLPLQVEDVTITWSEVGDKGLLIINPTTGECELKDKTISQTLAVKVFAAITVNNETLTKEFELTYKYSKSDEQLLAEELENIKLQFAEGEDESKVKSNIGLPTPINNSIKFTWSASNPKVTINNNQLIIPIDTFSQDTTVNIELVAKLGNTQKTKEFTITVLKNVLDDNQKVSWILNNTKLQFVENETELTVKTKVKISVPQEFSNKQIELIDDNALLAIENNEILIPGDSFASDTIVKVTVKCTINSVTDTKELTFTVLKNSYTDQEKLDKICNSFELKFKKGDSDTSVTKDVTINYSNEFSNVLVEVTTNNQNVLVENNQTIKVPKKTFLQDTEVVISFKATINSIEKTVTKTITIKQNLTQDELDLQNALANLQDQYTTKNNQIKLSKKLGDFEANYKANTSKIEFSEEGDFKVLTYKRNPTDTKTHTYKVKATITKNDASATRTIECVFEYEFSDAEVVDKVIKGLEKSKSVFKASEQVELPTEKDGVTITFVIVSSTNNLAVIDNNILKLTNTDINTDEVVKVKFTCKLNEVTKDFEKNYTFNHIPKITIKFKNLKNCTNESAFVDIVTTKGKTLQELLTVDPYFADIEKELFAYWKKEGTSQPFNPNKKIYDDTTFEAHWTEPLTNEQFLAAQSDDLLLTSGIVYKHESKGFLVYTKAGLLFIRTIDDEGNNFVGDNNGLAAVGSLIWFQGYKLKDNNKREIFLIKENGEGLEEAYWGAMQETIVLGNTATELLTQQIIDNKQVNTIVKVTFNVTSILTDQNQYDFVTDETSGNLNFKLLLVNSIVQESITNFKAAILNETGLGSWEIICYTALNEANELVFIPFKPFQIKSSFTFDDVVEKILHKEIQTIINTSNPKTTDSLTLVVSKLGITISYSDSDNKLSVDNGTAVIRLNDQNVTNDVVVNLQVNFTKDANNKTKNYNVKFTFVPDDNYLVGVAKNNLNLPQTLNHSVSSPATLVLPNMQDGVAISWEELENTFFNFVNGQLKDPNISGNVTVKLKATLTKGSATDTKEFSIEFVVVTDPDLVKLSQVAQEVKQGISTEVVYTAPLTGIVKEKDGVQLTYSDDGNLIDFENTLELKNKNITNDVQVIVKIKLSLNGKELNEQITVKFKYLKQWTITFDLDGGYSQSLPQSIKINDGDKIPTNLVLDIIHRDDHAKGPFLFFSENDSTQFDMNQIITRNINLKALYQSLNYVNTLQASAHNNLVNLRGIIKHISDNKVLLQDTTGYVVVVVNDKDISELAIGNEIILTANLSKNIGEVIYVTVAQSQYFSKANDTYPGFVQGASTQVTDVTNLNNSLLNQVITITYNHTTPLTSEQASSHTLQVLGNNNLVITNSYKDIVVVSEEYNIFWNYLKEDTSLGQYTFTFLYTLNGDSHEVFVLDANFFQKTELPNSVQVSFVKENLAITTELEADQKLDLPTSLANYTSVTIAWQETTVPALLNLITGLLIDQNIAENKTVNLKAAITKDDASETKEFTVTIKPVSQTITKVYSFPGIVTETSKFEDGEEVSSILKMDDLFTVTITKKGQGNVTTALYPKHLAIYQKSITTFALKDTNKKVVSLKIYFTNKSTPGLAPYVNDTQLTYQNGATNEFAVNSNSFTVEHKQGKKIFIEKIELVIEK